MAPSWSRGRLPTGRLCPSILQRHTGTAWSRHSGALRAALRMFSAACARSRWRRSSRTSRTPTTRSSRGRPSLTASSLRRSRRSLCVLGFSIGSLFSSARTMTRGPF
eukprot:Amastigsp_a1017_187.p4 type:complete len:107 gc:universal Amastigsp_a1017_187:966-646(-)